MRPIWTIDSESDPFSVGREPQPFLWGVFAGNTGRYYEFRKPSEVATFLQDKPVICFAHNGGKFDYMTRVQVGGTRKNPVYESMLDYLQPFQEITVINGRLAKFKIGACELRDSWNILPVPLRAFNKEEIDYAIMEKEQRHKPENWRKIRQYLKSDCSNLFELVTAYVDEFGLNLTQASGAMRFWRKLTGIDPPRTDHEFYDDHKKYYYGGRVECFRKGIIDAPFTVADITSAYPFAMLEYHPFSVDLVALKGTDLRGTAIEGYSFYDVACIARGCFPHRVGDDDEGEETSGSLQFPNDDNLRMYHVTGWELQAALDLGLIRDWQITRCLRPVHTLSFKEYIMHFWNMRRKAKQEGDRAHDLLAKLAMNSLYGKFAADPRNYGTFTVYDRKYTDVLCSDTHQKETGEDFAGFLGPWSLGERPLDLERQRFYNVTTSASITGFVRAYLLRSMAKCKGVLYCDTDSIAALDTSALKFGKELGDWGLEGSFNRAAIAGKKMYAFRHTKKQDDGSLWKVRSKGVRLTWQELVKVAKGGSVEYEPQVPTYSVHHLPRFTKRTVRMT